MPENIVNQPVRSNLHLSFYIPIYLKGYFYADIKFPVKLFFFLILLCCTLSSGLAQDEKKTPEVGKTAENVEDDDVLKISTDLIQTGVAVFYKKGQFVDNLRQEDFQLLVDGKPVPFRFSSKIR